MGELKEKLDSNLQPSATVNHLIRKCLLVRDLKALKAIKSHKFTNLSQSKHHQMSELLHRLISSVMA